MIISTIISRALRVLLSEVATPSTGELTRALEAFQSMITDLPGTIGVAWIDVPMEDNYVAGEDERITLRDTGLTVTLPTIVYNSGEGVPAATAYDACTMRQPLDGARVQVVEQSDGSSVLSFWRADRGEWMTANGMAASDESPLPAEMDRFLPAMLAVELQPEYGENLLSDSARALADKGWRRLRARYGGRKAVAVDSALLNLSAQSFGGRVSC